MTRPITPHGEDDFGNGIALFDLDNMIALIVGPGLPTDATAGYCKGCIFIQTDGAAGAMLLINEGSSTSCDFNALPTPGTAGAALVGLLDAGGFTSATNVESALAELYQHLFSAQGGFVDIPLATFREVDASGDVGDTTANGGVLSSNTTPIYLGDANEALAIQWAASNSDIIASSIALPADLDDTANVLLDLFVKSAGTSNDVAASVLTNFDGGAQVTDSAAALGGTFTDFHSITATIDAADVPAGARVMSLQIVMGAHATDAWSLYGARLRYKRKLLTS